MDQQNQELFSELLFLAAHDVKKVNIANGWYDDNRTFGDEMALLTSEVMEMFEEFRDHGFEDYTETRAMPIGEHDPLPKPLGVGSEAADILIRLLDTCDRHDINLGWEYFRKLEYNKTRGYRHGGKAI